MGTHPPLLAVVEALVGGYVLTLGGGNGCHSVLRIVMLWVWFTPTLALARGDMLPFDLPAQPLEQALERFSVVSGWSVMYPGALADGRRSQPVQGMMPPSQALEELLGGTGLAIEDAGEGRVVLRQVIGAELDQTSPPADLMDASAIRREFGGLQRRLRDAFCDHPLLAPGNYTARVGFRVDQNGRVRQPQLFHSSGAAKRDEALLKVLGELQLAASAAMLPQPVTLQIRKVPASHDCTRRPSP